MEKILIVDDSSTQALQLKSILDDDYDITVAHTAEEGLSHASTEDFSLILLDVVMPGMDGFTLLKKLQEEIITQSVPVILITSLSDIQRGSGYEKGGGTGLFPYGDGLLSGQTGAVSLERVGKTFSHGGCEAPSFS